MTAMAQHKANLLRTAGGLALAVAMSLPWSTSATSIFVVIWLLVLLPTLDAAAVRGALARPAGGLPVLLVALAVIGMLWSEVSWPEAFHGLTPFAKLLMIPLLLIQFRRSDRGLWVLGGFLFSCTVLLALSLMLAVWPTLTPSKAYGVPVKDYIAQAGEFVLCAFVAAYIAIDFFRAGRHVFAVGCLALSGIFLFDILYITSSRTALMTLPFLLLLLGWRQFGWRGAAAILIAGVAIGALVWTSSPYLRMRVTSLNHEVRAYELNNDVTSAGWRLYFWKNSIGIIETAPIIGHGTGSIEHTFAKATAGKTGPWAYPVANPHNQILGVEIQLGLVGVVALLAMWLSHLLLFRQPGLIAWIGLIVVVQNVISSLFNSHLFDFTEGWIYVFGVGVAGGAVLRAGAATRPQEDLEQAPAAKPIALDPARSSVKP
jgi:O-antigen ligase